MIRNNVDYFIIYYNFDNIFYFSLRPNPKKKKINIKIWLLITYNMKRRKVILPDPISVLHNNTDDYYAMKMYLKNMFECMSNEEGKNYLIICVTNITQYKMCGQNY